MTQQIIFIFCVYFFFAPGERAEWVNNTICRVGFRKSKWYRDRCGEPAWILIVPFAVSGRKRNADLRWWRLCLEIDLKNYTANIVHIFNFYFSATERRARWVKNTICWVGFRKSTKIGPMANHEVQKNEGSAPAPFSWISDILAISKCSTAHDST